MKYKILLIMCIALIACKKTTAPNAASSSGNQTTIGTTGTITYSVSIKRLAHTWYFKNTMQVRASGQWTTVKDSMTIYSKSYSYTGQPSGHPNKYLYLLQYQYLKGVPSDTSQAYLSDSINLQILVNGVVKRDTTVSGYNSSGGIQIYY